MARILLKDKSINKTLSFLSEKTLQASLPIYNTSVTDEMMSGCNLVGAPKAQRLISEYINHVINNGFTMAPTQAEFYKIVLSNAGVQENELGSIIGKLRDATATYLFLSNVMHDFFEMPTLLLDEDYKILADEIVYGVDDVADQYIFTCATCPMHALLLSAYVKRKVAVNNRHSTTHILMPNLCNANDLSDRDAALNQIIYRNKHNPNAAVDAIVKAALGHLIDTDTENAFVFSGSRVQIINHCNESIANAYLNSDKYLRESYTKTFLASTSNLCVQGLNITIRHFANPIKTSLESMQSDLLSILAGGDLTRAIIDKRLFRWLNLYIPTHLLPTTLSPDNQSYKSTYTYAEPIRANVAVIKHKGNIIECDRAPLISQTMRVKIDKAASWGRQLLVNYNKVLPAVVPALFGVATDQAFSDIISADSTAVNYLNAIMVFGPLAISIRADLHLMGTIETGYYSQPLDLNSFVRVFEHSVPKIT